MTGTKGKVVYLYLAIVCFFGLVAILIFDGYVGVYDTILLAAGERAETVVPDYWLRQGVPLPGETRIAYYTAATQGDRLDFRYEIDNRQFGAYQADVSVSVWQMRRKVEDIATKPVDVSPFARGEVAWTVEPARFKPSDLGAGQSYDFSIVISRGNIERQVVVNVSPVYLLGSPAPSAVTP